jgi:ABC-type multidrug transport system fused ATPase/permease subunit
LTFNYPGSDHFKLKNISVSIDSGKSLAIVGPSGSGKSTLVDLIIGLQAPTSGTILVSGLPPSEAIKKWPGSISYVAQETIIVNGSIKANVCLGYDPDSISDHLVLEALNKAQLKVLVESLPKGLNSEVGERGAKLSGGQRQRLGIARALLNNPKIIILDEATSSMDSLTENEINQTIESLKDTVTLIIIAHRLSSVKNSDKVIYINNGNAIAVGTFDDVRNSVPDFDKQAKLMGI